MTDPFDAAHLGYLFETYPSQPGRMKRRESKTLEIKENFNLSPDAKALYSRTMAGFANHEGGYILFGVKDSPHMLIGMSNTNFETFDPTQLQQILATYFAHDLVEEAFHLELTTGLTTKFVSSISAFRTQEETITESVLVRVQAMFSDVLTVATWCLTGTITGRL